jgi:hypothetical protein
MHFQLGCPANIEGFSPPSREEHISGFARNPMGPSANPGLRWRRVSSGGRVLKHKGRKEPRRVHGASHFLTRAPSDLESTPGLAMSQEPNFVVSLWIFVSFVFQKTTHAKGAKSEDAKRCRLKKNPARLENVELVFQIFGWCILKERL